MFAKVAEERSFARAARTLGLSVATVSRGVSRLEDRLGARLLNRTSRQLALTEFGRIVAERAGRLYVDAEQTEGAALELSAKPRGLVRLAVPMSLGLRWVAPILPEFLLAYPDISIDLHLSDATVDLVGQGFDAALRIAILPDSSLVARRLCAMSRFIVAAPAYLEEHGRPVHPRELTGRPCLGYAYNARNEAWHFVNEKGETERITPVGPLRVTNADALVPTVLAGLAIAELPEFIASDYLREGRMEAIMMDWKLPQGALYFVTPSIHGRAPKVDALAEFLFRHLSNPAWRCPDVHN